MSLKKNGLVIECESCRCISEIGDHAFEISVPMMDSHSDLAGVARLQCKISPESHTVLFKDWLDADAQDVPLSAELEQRLSGALNFVAEHKVCGNLKICPTEVNRIVKKISLP